MGSVWQTWCQFNAMALRPFRQQVDFETVVLAFALVLAVSGGWHYVLERVEL